MKYWLLLLHPQYSQIQGAKWQPPQRLCPDMSVAVKDKDKYFTLFHTIISYSGIKYFNKSVFVLPCCNYKNECWLYFIWNCHVIFFPSFGKKISDFVLYYEHKPMTGHMISFNYQSLESSLYTLQKNISLAYPQQCLQLQLLLTYSFSFIAVVWIVWNSETPSPLKSTLNNTEPAAERLTRNLYWRERLAFFLSYNCILIKLLTVGSSWQI